MLLQTQPCAGGKIGGLQVMMELQMSTVSSVLESTIPPDPTSVVSSATGFAKLPGCLGCACIQFPQIGYAGLSLGMLLHTVLNHLPS